LITFVARHAVYFQGSARRREFCHVFLASMVAGDPARRIVARITQQGRTRRGLRYGKVADAALARRPCGWRGRNPERMAVELASDKLTPTPMRQGRAPYPTVAFPCSPCNPLPTFPQRGVSPGVSAVRLATLVPVSGQAATRPPSCRLVLTVGSPPFLSFIAFSAIIGVVSSLFPQTGRATVATAAEHSGTATDLGPGSRPGPAARGCPCGRFPLPDHFLPLCPCFFRELKTPEPITSTTVDPLSFFLDRSLPPPPRHSHLPCFFPSLSPPSFLICFSLSGR